MAIIPCPGCGREISDRVHSCPWCEYLIEGGMPPRRQEEGDDLGMRLLLPVGRSAWAIVAGYLRLISILLIPAPLALITGVLAVRDINRNPKKHGLGRALFGVVMGVIGTVLLIVFVVALIVSPSTRR